jgi:hypothetical protein
MPGEHRNRREWTMKIQIALLAAVATTALAGTALAAASLNDVIQKGPAAAKVMEKNQINAATAKALGDHCLNEAAAKGMGVSVVIIDQFGVVSYYVRGDGQGKTNTEPAVEGQDHAQHPRSQQSADERGAHRRDIGIARDLAGQFRQCRRSPDHR